MNAMYQLGVSMFGLDATGSINGIPIFEATKENEKVVTMPVNAWLVGEGNVVKVEITGRADGARLQGSIEVADQGEMVEVPGGTQLELTEADSAELRFDSPVSPLKTTLDASEQGTAEEMIEFAITLRDTLKQGDQREMTALFASKAAAYGEAFGVDPEIIISDMTNMFDDFSKSDLSYEATDLEAIDRKDGKLWEVRRKDGNALVYAKDDGGSFSMPVYTAKQNGQIVVAR